MNYQEAMDFLEETKKYGSVMGLDSIRMLMEELGNVQDTLPIIHIAGTNGKGSTSAFLASIFMQAGYHVCRFATPDVFCYEEEFLYDENPIEKEELSQVFAVVKKACEKMVDNGFPHPTRFEVETASAFLWFSSKKPDVCVVEVGMGGETDATNIISAPLVSVITSISRDHVGFLGKTIADIALVKAGIIKQGCPVVSTWQPEEVANVILEKACNQKSKIVFSDFSKIDLPDRESDLMVGNYFSYKDRNNLLLSLQGVFQRQNAALTLDVIDCLKEHFIISEDAVREGLASAKWPGRFQLLGSEPDFYIDGAHNVDAVKKLRCTIDDCLKGQKVIYIMGVFEDKDYEDMIEIMFSEGDIVYCVTPDNPRALEARELCDELLDLDVKAYECASIKQAVETAIEFAQVIDGVVVAFGSLSYLKELKAAYEEATKGNPEGDIPLERFWMK